MGQFYEQIINYKSFDILRVTSCDTVNLRNNILTVK